ncbi:hypothetical protein SNE40_023217 [Patella caerulea]|uniref:Dipeptidase n=1 Tax=Patella caerulea TaxID=87958 RepID=A0AAN8IVV8_PATCE
MSGKEPLTFGNTGGCNKNRLLIGGVIGFVVFAIVIGLAVGIPLSKRSTDEENLARAKRILNEVPLIDGHNDLAWQYRKQAQNQVYKVNLADSLIGVWNITHTDIPRIQQGHLKAQFWALYVPCDSQYIDAVRQSLDQMDTIKKFVARYPDVFRFVTTADGIINAVKAKRFASLVGLEGGHSIDSSLGNLRMFYDLGVRYMTITHSCNTPWADNWKMDNADNTITPLNGLTDFGKLVIKEMNRLGMLVDLSHVSEKTMLDSLEVATAPVIFSHSSAWAICNHNRNVRDNVLLKTKENGGVVMVNFYSDYVNCAPNELPQANLAQVADHIDYIKNLTGVDHVGIGADYDGVERVPVGLEDVSKYPALFAELAKRGWTDAELKKLAGENLLRVFKKAEEVRDQMMKDGIPPYEDHIAVGQLKNTTCRSGPF